MTSISRSCLSQGIMSASAITSAETCEQLAYFQYEDGWQAKAMSKGLKTGLSMHDGEEMYINGHNEAPLKQRYSYQAGMKMNCFFQRYGHTSKATMKNGSPSTQSNLALLET